MLYLPTRQKQNSQLPFIDRLHPHFPPSLPLLRRPLFDRRNTPLRHRLDRRRCNPWENLIQIFLKINRNFKFFKKKPKTHITQLNPKSHLVFEASSGWSDPPSQDPSSGFSKQAQIKSNQIKIETFHNSPQKPRFPNRFQKKKKLRLWNKIWGEQTSMSLTRSSRSSGESSSQSAKASSCP